jgi:hypothetical protein
LFERIIILFILLTSFFTVSCKSTGTEPVVSYIGITDTKYRDISNEIRNQQSELGITGQRIEDRSRQLEQSIAGGTEPIQSIRSILQQVRGQSSIINESITTGDTDNPTTTESTES